MGSCIGTKSSNKLTKEDAEQHSLNTHEKNKLKMEVFMHKAAAAPKLDLHSNTLYAKRKDHL